MTSSDIGPSVQINFTCTRTFRDHLKKEADKQRRPVAELIRFALEDAYPTSAVKQQEKRSEQFAIQEAAQQETRDAGATR